MLLKALTMIKSLLLAAAFLPSPPSFAQDATQPTERQIEPTVEQDAEKPAPQLLSLDLLLAQTQEDKQRDLIDEKRYQEFLKKFRADLEAAMARVEPTPANTAQHARILSRLGDSEQALGALGPALEQDPANPALRAALGQIRFDQKDYPAALAEANAVLELDPANKGALALKHFSEGRIGPGGAASSAVAQGIPGGAAIEQFRAPLAKDSPKVQALVPSIRDARSSGDMRTAMSLAQELMRAEPASEYAQEIYRIVAKDHARWQRVQATIGYINSAKAALTAGRGDEASAWANKAVQTDPAPAVLKFAEDVRKIVGEGKIEETPQKPKAPKDDGIPLWPMLPIAGLGAAAYAVAKSRRTVESEDGFDEENRPLYGRLQQFVAGAILAGIAGAGVYFVGAATIPVALRYLAGPGQHTTRLLQSEAGAINPGEQKAVNEVPKMFARVIPFNPGSPMPPTIGRANDPSVFVTAAEDVAGLNAAQLSQRLGIKSAQEFLIIRFPAPKPGLSTPLSFDDPQFVGRGLTSGGAREFMIPNGTLPTTATFEVVK